MDLRTLFLLPLLIPALAAAGPKFTFDEGKKSLEILQAYQIWGAATFNPQGAPAPDPRADLYVRRARLGLKGQAYPGVDYLVWLAYDNLGKDPNTGSLGAPQPMGNTTFQVWDAYLTWHADSAWANLTFGLFRPQAGGEYLASFTAVPSLEKALTHYYLRDHLTTRPSGRETGINLGGYRPDTSLGFSFGYNVGIFDAAQEKAAGVAAGSTAWSPLLTARLSATLGDPENKDYRLNSDLNFFGERKGATLAVYGTWQGETDEKLDTSMANPYVGGFRSNSVFGANLLCNWAGLELDGEIDFLRREFTDAFPARYAATRKNPAYVASQDFMDRVWHARAGYSFPLASGQFLEPTLLYARFDGDESSPANTDGSDQVLDAGVNWYVQKQNLKIGLHYVWQEGEAKSLFTQGPARNGSLKQRNDYVALGALFNY